MIRIWHPDAPKLYVVPVHHRLPLLVFPMRAAGVSTSHDRSSVPSRLSLSMPWASLPGRWVLRYSATMAIASDANPRSLQR